MGSKPICGGGGGKQSSRPPRLGPEMLAPWNRNRAAGCSRPGTRAGRHAFGRRGSLWSLAGPRTSRQRAIGDETPPVSAQ
eukprot:5183752-Pyramimonas_sp.AAC.1